MNMNKVISYQLKRLLLAGVLLCSPIIGLSQNQVSISFKGVEINSVLESVAEITGKTFIVDPRVKGKLTIISTEPIDADLLFEVFLSALQVHGFQAVADGPIYRILPLSQAYRVPDQGTGGILHTEVIKIKYGNANNVVSGVRPLLSQGALLQAHQDSNSLIINDTRSQIDRIKSIIRKLDKLEPDNLEVISLTYTTVPEILRMAKELKLDKDERVNLVEDDISNRLLISGPVELRKPIRELIEKLDTPQENSSNIDVIYLHYLESEKAKTLIEGMLNGGAFDHIAGVKSKNNEKKYSVQEDEANNALVVAGSQELMASIRVLINKLDRPRVQVLIEAVIAEVTQDQARDLGAQLAFLSDQGGGIIDFDGALTALTGGALGLADDSVTRAAAATAAGPLVSSQGLSFGGAATNDSRTRGIGILVQTLQSNSQANILSTPSILTMDNEEASISVGQEVPFLTGSFTSTGTGTANPFQTIERQEVGISLKVTPQVNEGDAVRLKIEQESSSLLPSSGGNSALQQITAKRTISTNVMVYDGQLLVLGGLLDQSESKSKSKVPILGDIPLLGYLFKTQNKSQRDNVLMVFIRPTILRTQGEAGDISRQKYKYLRGRQDLRENNLKTGSIITETLEELAREPVKKIESATMETRVLEFGEVSEPINEQDDNQ